MATPSLAHVVLLWLCLQGSTSWSGTLGLLQSPQMWQRLSGSPGAHLATSQAGGQALSGPRFRWVRQSGIEPQTSGSLSMPLYLYLALLSPAAADLAGGHMQAGLTAAAVESTEHPSRSQSCFPCGQ